MFRARATNIPIAEQFHLPPDRSAQRAACAMLPMSLWGQSLPKSTIQVTSGYPPRAEVQRTSPLFRNAPILLQKSFWGGERKFLEPLMRLARGDARDHIVSSKIDHGPP
jgi:hypothetical protein